MEHQAIDNHHVDKADSKVEIAEAVDNRGNVASIDQILDSIKKRSLESKNRTF